MIKEKKKEEEEGEGGGGGGKTTIIHKMCKCSFIFSFIFNRCVLRRLYKSVYILYFSITPMVYHNKFIKSTLVGAIFFSPKMAGQCIKENDDLTSNL